MELRASAHFMQDVTGNLFHNPRVRFIPIRASRVGCDCRRGHHGGKFCVSIHASRVGCDLDTERGTGTRYGFNPRIPCGMRLFVGYVISASSGFNPRIPCGMRRAVGLQFRVRRGFNPRIPCGMRPTDYNSIAENLVFQSTHPVWDATAVRPSHWEMDEVSIHASRVGCDSVSCNNTTLALSFNPRIPCGMRLAGVYAHVNIA